MDRPTDEDVWVPEAITAYEQMIAPEDDLEDDIDLIAARQGQQPDWANL